MTRAPTAAGFRVALLLYVALVLAMFVVAAAFAGADAGGADGSGGDTMATAMAEAQAILDAADPASTPSEGVLTALLLVFLVLNVVSVAGLFLFRAWGRSLALWSTLLSLPVTLWLGPSLVSATESMLYDAANLLWGGLLAVAYWSPLAASFDRSGDDRPSLSA